VGRGKGFLSEKKGEKRWGEGEPSFEVRRQKTIGEREKKKKSRFLGKGKKKTELTSWLGGQFKKPPP